MLALLEWAFFTVITAAFLLLLSILLWFVWNLLMHLVNGPTLSFFNVALIAAIVSLRVWNFSPFRRSTV